MAIEIGFLCFVYAGPLRRPGSDLLSHTLRCSTISAKRFHGRVREGIGWFTLAITTRSSKRANVIFDFMNVVFFR